ncbi:MAG TPA: hypothetical protein VJ023_14650 [Pyrinomonadaceae bacterium]|nr:hypothetical protein [Pyrinomonadaceae bacterium]
MSDKLQFVAKFDKLKLVGHIKPTQYGPLRRRFSVRETWIQLSN